MPGKTKNLPLPCPICDKPHGTIQLLFSGKHDIIVRIGHYRSPSVLGFKKSYAQSGELPLGYTKEKGDFKSKKKTTISPGLKRAYRTVQREWCSFRSNNVFFDSLRDNVIDNMVNGYRILVGRGDPPSIIKLNEQAKLSLQQHIVRFGWQRIPLQN